MASALFTRALLCKEHELRLRSCTALIAFTFSMSFLFKSTCCLGVPSQMCGFDWVTVRRRISGRTVQLFGVFDSFGWVVFSFACFSLALVWLTPLLYESPSGNMVDGLPLVAYVIDDLSSLIFLGFVCQNHAPSNMVLGYDDILPLAKRRCIQ